MKGNGEHYIPCPGNTEETKLTAPSAFFINKSKSDCYIKHIFKCADGLEPNSKEFQTFYCHWGKQINVPPACLMNKSKSDCYMKHIVKCADCLELMIETSRIFQCM